MQKKKYSLSSSYVIIINIHLQWKDSQIFESGMYIWEVTFFVNCLGKMGTTRFRNGHVHKQRCLSI